MKTITNSTDSGRREALGWLAGALHWEGVLADLRGEPIADDQATEPEAIRQPEAA